MEKLRQGNICAYFYSTQEINDNYYLIAFLHYLLINSFQRQYNEKVNERNERLTIVINVLGWLSRESSNPNV